MKKNILAKKYFTLKDLLWFSEQSGDYNPIHINEEVSRRYISGGIVVPGMYLLLWSLNNIIKELKKNINYINAKFHHVATLNDYLELNYELAGNVCFLYIKSGLRSIATFKLIFSDDIIADSSEKKKPPKSKIKNYSFEELKGLSGNLKTYLSDDSINQFNYLKKYKMENIVSNLMAFSRLVGMRLPGLNSLFIGLEIKFVKPLKKKHIKWSVSRHTNIYSLIFLNVTGNGYNGQLSTMYRAEPVRQPEIRDIYRNYKNSNFSNQVALIIGGSRGLGEYTAKLLASNGSEVIITYNQGLKDALIVKKEIKNYNGKVHCLNMNILDPLPAIKKINLLKLNITHVYYFASPKIQESRQKIMDRTLLEKYNLIYVKSFQDIIKTIFDFFNGDFMVFYPSSIFITQNSVLYKEYTKSKLYAEKEIQKLNIKYKKDFIHYARLPKLRTDQNPNLSIKEHSLNIKTFIKELLIFSNLNSKRM